MVMKKNSPSPPRLFHRFFRWFCHPELQKYIEGDLLELYDERLKTSGKRIADIQFMKEVLLLLRPGIIRPAGRYHPVNNCAMFKNYFKAGMRNILKYKAFSFINVFGLALAMSVCMLIMLMLADHRSYDQFHSNRERIYRILSDRDNSKAPSATTPFSLAENLRSYPIIQETTHLTRGVASDLRYDHQSVEVRGYFADSAFFKVFDFKLENGSPASALTSPNAIVITSTLAHRLFREGSPLGKVVDIRNTSTDSTIHWGKFTVTGILSDEKYRSHLKFDILVSSSSMHLLWKEEKLQDPTNDWQNNNSYSYVLLAPDKTGDDLTAALNDLINRKKDELHDIKGFTLMAQKLTQITPGMLVTNESRATLPMAVYYFLVVLAIVILVSACLNYANLSTARALTRAKEIGIRKVTGALRKDLIYQFLSEAIITSTLALVMAVFIVLILKAAFLELSMNRYLEFSLNGSLSVYAAFALFALLTGLIAGLYPALYLSGFQPIKAMKSNNGSRGAKTGIRKTLSVSQFAVSLFFITTSILLFNQFRHFMKFEYGFDANNVINVPLQGNDYRKVAHEFGGVAGVASISACNYVPSTGTNNTITLKPVGRDQGYQRLTILVTDENFTENLGIDLIAGKNLTPNDSASAFVLVNDAAVKAFGFQRPDEIVGQALEGEWNREPLEVIGVVKDFFVKTPMGEDEVSPLVILSQPDEFRYANIKIVSPDLMGTVRRLETVWKGIDPIHAFEYAFYDEQLASMHQGLLDIVSIIGFIAFIAITIACLGLLGMSAYSAERKKREVGIRKVLGAGEWALALLLSKDFLKIIASSIVIGAPLSFVINNLWLQKFPNRVDFGIGTILLGALVLLLLGLITIGSQTFTASKRNPVDVLKAE